MSKINLVLDLDNTLISSISFREMKRLKNLNKRKLKFKVMEKISIEAKNVGERIDRFLVREFFLYSRGEIIRRIKKGEVLLNGKPVKPSYKLEEEDEIDLENFSEKVIENKLIPNKNRLMTVSDALNEWKPLAIKRMMNLIKEKRLQATAMFYDSLRTKPISHSFFN